MSKNVQIDEPFQLSTYTSSNRGKQKTPASDHVFARSLKATSSKSKSSREGLVTVAAQADGIHLVDISSLHTVVSHTLGPSTSFSCPAVTIGSENDEYTSYAVIKASPELTNADEAGRVVWKWKDSLSSASDASEKQKDSKLVAKESERIHGLYTTPDNQIIAVTQTARVLLLDADLDEKSSLSLSSDKPLDVYRVFVFSSSECPFSPSGAVATVVIASFDDSSSLNVHVVALSSSSELAASSHARLSQKREVIADISCSPSGCFSILCKDGGWGSFTLSPNSSNFLRPLARPVKLANLSTDEISTTALTSSHVLLVALPKSSPSVVHLQIWDLQYSVLLSSHTMPLPTAFASAPPSLKVVPVDAALDSSQEGGVRGQAVLSLSTSSGISTLFVVPYLVPHQSTLAVAIGRGSATKVWLQSVAPQASAKGKDESGHKKVLDDVKAAMNAGKVQVAENAFSVWLMDAEAKQESRSQPALDYNFVKELLQLILPPVGKSAPTHAPVIVKKLLEGNGVVSSSMVEGGLLPALRVRSDWASIDLAFSSVVDLPESHIIETLVVLAKLHNHHQQQPASGEAMQVDAPASSAVDALPLPLYLSHCVTYPNATSKGIVLALKKFVRDPKDAVPIAQVLEGWIKVLGQQRRANGELGLLPSNKDLEKNEHGVWIVNPQKKLHKKGTAKKAAIPSLAKVVSFLQSFMDACFLQLLQHASSHKLIQQLQAHLNEETAFADLLEQLRGSLEPYAVGHQKALKEAAIPEKERERQRQKGDWRQRRHGAPGVVGNVGAIGVYQVEELAL